MLQIVTKFIFKFPSPDTRATRTISKRIPSLNHKLGDDTMKNDPFKVSTPSMSNKVLHSFRNLLREEADVNVTKGGVDGGSVGNR